MNLLIYLSPPMPNRPCSFSLNLQDGSVFADFDIDSKRIISLIRISYDSFGCCEPRNPTTQMDEIDSNIILEAISSNDFENSKVEETLRRYFRANKDSIWCDALEKHDLL